MNLLWNESEIEVKIVDGKEVRYLNKDASLRFFDIFREELVANGLAGFEGRLFTEQHAKLVAEKIMEERSKKPVEETPVEEKPAEETPVEETPVEEEPVEELDEVNKLFAAKISIDFTQYLKYMFDDSEDVFDTTLVEVTFLSRYLVEMYKHVFLTNDEEMNVKLIKNAVNNVVTHKVNDATVLNALRLANRRIMVFDQASKEAYVKAILDDSDPLSGLLQLENICRVLPDAKEEYKELIYLVASQMVNTLAEDLNKQELNKVLISIKSYSPALYNEVIKKASWVHLNLCDVSQELEDDKTDTRYKKDYFKIIDAKYKKPIVEEFEDLDDEFSTRKPSGEDHTDGSDDEFADLDDDEFGDLDAEETPVEEQPTEEEEYTVTRKGKFLTLTKYALYAVSALSGLATLYYGFVNRDHFTEFATSIGAFLATMAANIKINHINEKKTDDDEDEYEDSEDLDEDIEEEFMRHL